MGTGGQERSDRGIGTGGQERSDRGIGTGGQERSDRGIGTGGQERSDRGIGAVHAVTLLTRADCSLCAKARAVLESLSDELGFELSAVDVDAAAAAGDPTLRAEYGDLLPVVLLDGVQHSYWEVDADGLRADLGGPRPGAWVPDQARESRSDVPR